MTQERDGDYDVFISYRRDGGVDYARMIYQELRRRGYHAFFDYNSLRDGKFNERIFKAIDECRYFILVLTDGSLERCRNEDDWVRREIVYALSRGKRIVPVCPSGNSRAFPDAMPDCLLPLRSLQISVLQTDDLFEKSVDKIVEDRFDVVFRKKHSSAGFKRAFVGGLLLMAVGAVMVVVRCNRSIGLSSGQRVEIADMSQSIAEQTLQGVLPQIHYTCVKCGAFTVETGARKPDPTGCKGDDAHKWMYLQEVGDKKYKCKQCGKVLMTQGLPMDAVLGNIQLDVSRVVNRTGKGLRPKSRSEETVAKSCADTHRHTWEKVGGEK